MEGRKENWEDYLYMTHSYWFLYETTTNARKIHT